jgi:hypothetical protein
MLKIGKMIKYYRMLFLCCVLACTQLSCDLLLPETVKQTIEVFVSSLKNSVKVNEPVTLSIKIVDSLGNANIVEWSYKADYDGNGTISEDETNISDSYSGETQVTTRNLTKEGSLEFIVDALNAQGASADSAKTSVNVTTPEEPEEPEEPEDLPPTVNLTGIDFELIDAQENQFTLPIPSDPDTPGEVLYKQVEILQGAENLESYNITPAGILTFKPRSIIKNSPYQIRLTYENATGVRNSSIISSEILNLFQASGTLKSVRSNSASNGILEVYDITTKAKIGEISTATGEFDIKATTPSTGKVSLQARLNPDGFWEKIELENEDKTGLNVFAVPAPDFYLDPPTNLNKCTKEQFREFASSTNMPEWILDDKEVGLGKGLADYLVGIEIVDIHPNITKGSYTQTQMNDIETFLNDSNGIRKILNGRDIGSIIQKDNSSSTRHYTANGGTLTYIEPGYLIILPNKTLTGGFTVPYYLNNQLSGIVNTAKIEIGTTYNINQAILYHEVLHALLATRGHAPQEFEKVSMMVQGLRIYTPGIADEWLRDIVYHPAYAPRSRLDQHLALTSGVD